LTAEIIFPPGIGFDVIESFVTHVNLHGQEANHADAAATGFLAGSFAHGDIVLVARVAVLPQEPSVFSLFLILGKRISRKAK